jgi:hypothetical protein
MCACVRRSLDEALAYARQAIQLLSEHRVLLGHALSLEASVLMEQGKVAEAWSPALAGLKIADDLGGQLSSELAPAVVVAQLHARTGNQLEAREVATRGLARVRWYASRFTAEDAELCAAYLERPEVAALRELAAAPHV